MNHYYAVIMAGGGGTRLWPLSRQHRPKQMLALLGDATLFQATVARLDGLFPPERTYVVTVTEQAAQLQEQAPGIPRHNYLLEPAPRGTASVVGLAAVALQQQDPNAVMAVLPSDHFVRNVPRFQQLLRAAYHVAQEGYLVTLGITPTYPATGYGYIQRGEPLGTYEGLEAYRVLRFKEKPDRKQAEAMLAQGGHAWNSGMFVWRVDAILAEIARQMPDLHSGLQEIAAVWNTPQRAAVIRRVWLALRTETVDYGIMEGAQKVAVIPAEGVGWSDVGSWESLFDILTPDESGNLTVGGSGKTPFSAWLAGRLAARGSAVAVLARGYGRDEIELHRRLNPAVEVLVGSDRVAAAREAAARGMRVAVLDDGFQHRRLARDLDVVLHAAEERFPGRMLPRGPYREPPASLGRAHHVVVTRRTAPGRDARELCLRLRTHAPLAGLGLVRLAPDGWWTLVGARAPAPAGPVLAVASVARPEVFRDTLAGMLDAPVELAAYPDHHEYTRAEATRIVARAAGRVVVTTWKDAVKLAELTTEIERFRVLGERVVWEWGEDAFLHRIDTLITSTTGP